MNSVINTDINAVNVEMLGGITSGTIFAAGIAMLVDVFLGPVAVSAGA